MARIVITVEVDVDPSLAAYLLDPYADDPVPSLVGAEWATA